MNQTRLSLYLFHLSILLVILLHHKCYCLAPICQPNEAKYVGPPLPAMPDQYFSSQELTPSSLNISSRIDEYFDYKQNKAVTIITSMGLKSKTIYDYNTMKQYVISGINDFAPTCFVRDIINMPDEMLALAAKNGHLKHAVDVIMFNGSNQAIQYEGISTIRGIRCNHWTLCRNSANSSQLLHYYFAVDGWLLPTLTEHFYPVLITIEGLFIIQGVSTIQKTKTSMHTFAFETTTPPDDVFQITHGVLCDVAVSNLTVPILPNDFYAEYEYYSLQDNKHHVIKAYYDFSHGLARVTSTTHSGTWMYKVVDYHGGVMYDVKHVYDNPDNVYRFSCDVSMIKQDKQTNSSFVGNTTQPHFTMKTAMERFNLSPFKYSYQGVGNIRGRDVNIWVSSHDSMELFGGKPSIVEWSFLRGSHTPIQLAIYDRADRSNKTVINIFSFDRLDSTPANVRALSYCYKGNKQLISFRVENNFPKEISADARNHGIEEALAKYGKVPLLRVASTEVQNMGKSLYVVTTVFGPLVLTNTSNGNKIPIQISLGVAVDNIKKAVENGQFEVMVNQTGVITKATAMTSSFSIGNKQSSTTTKSVNSGLSTSQIVIIVAVVICIVLSVISIIYISLRRRGINLFAYEKYGNDNDNL